jgi:hypothetical protein
MDAIRAAAVAEEMAASLEAFAEKAEDAPSEITGADRQNAMDAHTGLIAMRIAERLGRFRQ